MNYDEMLKDETLKLTMLAGAFAIRNNKKYNTGFFTSGGKSMPWREAEEKYFGKYVPTKQANIFSA